MNQGSDNKFIVVSYLFFIAIFGVIVAVFLWLRDIRIYIRTGLPGYRESARKGVLYTALATAGAGEIIILPSADILGAGIVLLALYLQGKVRKERVFANEPVLERFLGKTPRRRS
jgi:hypothetical protein